MTKAVAMDDPKSPPPLWGSVRLTVAVAVAVSLCHMYLIKFSTSMAVVCMTGTKIGLNESKYAVKVTGTN
jgi:hypothetical protein